MTDYRYLIIGGGMTAAAAADGIREVDSTGTIGLISAEADAPYNRPPLSKALWKGEPLETIWRKTENKRVEMHLCRIVKEIVPTQKRVVDDEEKVFTYEKLLLATGGKPRRLPFGDDHVALAGLALATHDLDVDQLRLAALERAVGVRDRQGPASV